MAEQPIIGIKKKIADLNDIHQSLLVRIVGITDEELRDQLRCECVEIEEQMKAEQQRYMQIQIRIWNEELRCEYEEKFAKSCNLIKSIEYANKLPDGHISDICQKNRLRMPKTLAQKKELFWLGKSMECVFVVKDLEYNVIDTIGDQQYAKNELVIFIFAFKRFDRIDIQNGRFKFACPKQLYV